MASLPTAASGPPPAQPGALATQSRDSSAPGTGSGSGPRLSGPADVPAPVARPLARALADPAARAPLPLGVRARLAPLLGQDVTGVHVIQNAQASEATAAAAADALAVGNAVLLGPGQDLASPRALGLLAHELTHVLRTRDPGFVPAVMRAGPQGRGQAARLDEEALAERVEGRVRGHLAQRPAGGLGPEVGAVPLPAHQRSPGPSASPAPSTGGWGGLPAPWEPMPYWDTPAPGAAPGSPKASFPAAPAPASPPVAPAPGASAPAVRAASRTRSVDSPGQAASAPAADPARTQGLPVGNDQHRAGRTAPDLDRLAQQVYGLLKRRLSAEVRRDP
ncbi:eCIS core domain-containing protein [Deinococcus phoenicis]|uniref:eCIS core domain-containing protein n=1 Tax=Deinococcus phoenicis TaxID=1476583 RepID=UPI001267C071|nr:DUF4157 domain-containing protein [Deinococcus phoenicis]